MVKTATIKATGEKLIVFKLKNGNWFDYQNMGASDKPTCAKADKKEFTEDELVLGNEINKA